MPDNRIAIKKPDGRKIIGTLGSDYWIYYKELSEKTGELRIACASNHNHLSDEICFLEQPITLSDTLEQIYGETSINVQVCVTRPISGIKEAAKVKNVWKFGEEPMPRELEGRVIIREDGLLDICTNLEKQGTNSVPGLLPKGTFIRWEEISGKEPPENINVWYNNRGEQVYEKREDGWYEREQRVNISILSSGAFPINIANKGRAAIDGSNVGIVQRNGNIGLFGEPGLSIYVEYEDGNIAVVGITPSMARFSILLKDSNGEVRKFPVQSIIDYYWENADKTNDTYQTISVDRTRDVATRSTFQGLNVIAQCLKTTLNEKKKKELKENECDYTGNNVYRDSRNF